MSGGMGSDSYLVDSAGDIVFEFWGGETDTIYSTVGVVLPFLVEQLVLLGTANLSGIGNDMANVIVGNSGDNILDGRGGADAIAGGAGNDSYFVDTIYDGVVEYAGGGTDIVYSTVNMVLTPNVENLQLLGPYALTGVGNDLANVIVGNVGDNVLDGRAGADAMAGGTGNDSYFVDRPGDVVVENAGEGTDIVYTTVSYNLPAEVENLQIYGTSAANAVGNMLANLMVGNGASNRLDGGGGRDALFGGDGADTFVFRKGEANGDLIADFAGAGGGDHIALLGYGSGSTFGHVAGTNNWQITDAANGAVETITVFGTIAPGDYLFG